MVSPEAVRADIRVLAGGWGSYRSATTGASVERSARIGAAIFGGFAPDKHGCVTCVLHGLTWRVDPKAEDAGRLVSNAALPDWGSAWAGNQQGGTI